MDKKPTKQGISPRSGTTPPKDRQFGQPNGNPRHNGAWKKEDTPRYKLEQMMKLSRSDLQSVIESDEAPLFEVKLAQAIMNGRWREIESMVNQVYGTPKQTQDITTGGDKLQPLMVKFLDDDRNT